MVPGGGCGSLLTSTSDEEGSFLIGGNCYVHGRIQSFNWPKRKINHTIEVSWAARKRVRSYERLGWLSFYLSDGREAFEQQLRSLPLTNKNARTFSRFFVAGATACELDKQGRILVPSTLREFAELDKDVVLTGNINRIEIWVSRSGSENSNYDDMDAIAEGLQDLGSPSNRAGRYKEPYRRWK